MAKLGPTFRGIDMAAKAPPQVVGVDRNAIRTGDDRGINAIRICDDRLELALRR